jgi:hypothetical protein
VSKSELPDGFVQLSSYARLDKAEGRKPTAEQVQFGWHQDHRAIGLKAGHTYQLDGLITRKTAVMLFRGYFRPKDVIKKFLSNHFIQINRQDYAHRKGSKFYKNDAPVLRVLDNGELKLFWKEKGKLELSGENLIKILSQDSPAFGWGGKDNSRVNSFKLVGAYRFDYISQENNAEYIEAVDWIATLDGVEAAYHEFFGMMGQCDINKARSNKSGLNDLKFREIEEKLRLEIKTTRLNLGKIGLWLRTNQGKKSPLHRELMNKWRAIEIEYREWARFNNGDDITRQWHKQNPDNRFVKIDWSNSIEQRQLYNQPPQAEIKLTSLLKDLQKDIVTKIKLQKTNKQHIKLG